MQMQVFFERHARIVFESLLSISLHVRSGIPVCCCHLLLLLSILDRQTIDVQILTDPIDRLDRPAHVRHTGEDEISQQVHILHCGVHGCKAERGQICDQGPDDEGHELHGPDWEGAASEVAQDDFCGQATENKGHCQAEKEEMVVREEGGVGGSEPQQYGAGVNDHGDPFEENGQDGEFGSATGGDDVGDAEGDVTEDEGPADDGDPEIDEADRTEESRS